MTSHIRRRLPACCGAAYGGDTKTKSLRNACFAVVAGCCFLLPSGAATADAQPPPSPEELWEAFPLEPQPTTPLDPRATTPAPQLPTTDPAPVPVLPGSDADTGWSVVVGGLVGAALLVVALLLAKVVRARRRAARTPETARELIARAYALAKEAFECDMLQAHQRNEGIAGMSESAEHDHPAAQAASSSGSRGYAEIGERVAGVLSAAEAAADEIRAGARQDAEELLRVAKGEADQVHRDAAAYERDTRSAVDSYATNRRREAEQQVQRQLADAEGQTRATREAAEEMARRIEEEARLRGQTLREESKAVEERLKKALSGLHRMTAQLEELVGTPTAAQTDGESLADALKPYGQRDGELQPLLEER